ncbi:MAG: hypothetical protein H6772_00075 [Pseudomonadales bacterium]|nr:hypothetical protein [Pseudomonadales bacterium]
MIEDLQNSAEGLKHQNGLSFREAISSTFKIWENHLKKENYKGNAEEAGHLMEIFCNGIQYAYKELLKRNKIKDITLPRVDFDQLPKGMTIVYLAQYQTIVVSTSFLKEFEGYSLETILTRIDNFNELQFKGKIKEFWFSKGVEEFVHSVDPDIKKSTFEQIENNGGTVKYHAQKHEYKALGWRLKASRDQHFDENTITVLENLLKKIIEHRRSNNK